MTRIGLIIAVFVFCSVQRCRSLGTSEENGKGNNALAYVSNVKASNVDNQWMSVVRDSNADSGWAVKVKRFVSEENMFENFVANMRAKSYPSGSTNYFYDAYLCYYIDLEYSTDVLPAQLIDMIFPGRQGNCNFTEGTRAIKRSAYVNVDPDDNPHVNFPNPITPMEVTVDVLSEENNNRYYFFQVVFVIGGSLPETTAAPSTMAPETTIASTTTVEPQMTTESASSSASTSMAPETTIASTTTVEPEMTTESASSSASTSMAPETTIASTTVVEPEMTTDLATTSAPTTSDAPQTTSKPTTTDVPDTTSEPSTTVAPETTEENKDQSGYYCFNARWNYYVIWRICTIAEFIESNIFEVGRRIMFIF